LRSSSITSPGRARSRRREGRAEEYDHIRSFEGIVAKVYKGESWFDQKECIVLDYSETSMVAHWIRDEIRLIQPKTYLGKVYWERSRLSHFLLEF
jgi:hypothetical protein